MIDDSVMHLLKNMPPFGEVSPADLGLLVSLFRVKTLRHGKALYYQEDWADTLFFLLQGRVRQKKWRQDQTHFLLGEKSPGTWLGLAEVASGGEYLCDTECLCETLALTIPSSAMGRLMEFAPVRNSLMRSLADSIYRLHSTLESPGSLALICRCLKELPCRDNRVTVTQEQIAKRVGLTRETVSKHLHQLQIDQVIRLGRGQIMILDSDGLE